MTESNISIKRYSHQHYTALFDKSTGILIRIEDAGFKGQCLKGWCKLGEPNEEKG